MAVTHGSTGDAISKLATLGKTLTNGNSAIANYNVFALTINFDTSTSATTVTTLIFVRGKSGRYMACRVPSQGSTTWYRIDITLNNNTFSYRVAGTNKLDPDSEFSAVTNDRTTFE